MTMTSPTPQFYHAAGHAMVSGEELYKIRETTMMSDQAKKELAATLEKDLPERIGHTTRAQKNCNNTENAFRIWNAIGHKPDDKTIATIENALKFRLSTNLAALKTMQVTRDNIYWTNRAMKTIGKTFDATTSSLIARQIQAQTIRSIHVHTDMTSVVIDITKARGALETIGMTFSPEDRFMIYQALASKTHDWNNRAKAGNETEFRLMTARALSEAGYSKKEVDNMIASINGVTQEQLTLQAE